LAPEQGQEVGCLGSRGHHRSLPGSASVTDTTFLDTVYCTPYTNVVPTLGATHALSLSRNLDERARRRSLSRLLGAPLRLRASDGGRRFRLFDRPVRGLEPDLPAA